jgi:hypothetical protein
MSVSPVGNSDAYSRYRQQQLDLLSSAGQSAMPAQTTSQASPLDLDDPTASNTDVSKSKAAHGHHRHHGAPADATASTSDASTSTDATGAATGTDTFSQTMDELAGILNVAAKVASVVI